MHDEISANAENGAFRSGPQSPLINGLQTVSPLQLFNYEDYEWRKNNVQEIGSSDPND